MPTTSGLLIAYLPNQTAQGPESVDSTLKRLQDEVFIAPPTSQAGLLFGGRIMPRVSHQVSGIVEYFMGTYCSKPSIRIKVR